MTKNMGTADRTIRILIAVTLAVLYFANIITGTTAIILLIVAAIFLITGIAGVCPLYLVAGLNTRKKNQVI